MLGVAETRFAWENDSGVAETGEMLGGRWAMLGVAETRFARGNARGLPGRVAREVQPPELTDDCCFFLYLPHSSYLFMMCAISGERAVCGLHWLHSVKQRQVHACDRALAGWAPPTSTHIYIYIYI